MVRLPGDFIELLVKRNNEITKHIMNQNCN